MILIDYKDRRPLYEQIVEKLSDLMVRGILEQDSQLPSVRSLATELSMNPNTIQRAYAELERQGYIYSVKGRGSFVADNRQIRERKRQEIWDQLELLIRDAKGTGITMLEFQEQARKASGSQIARILKPHDVVTLEYRSERLNLNVDERGVVTRVNCG